MKRIKKYIKRKADREKVVRAVISETGWKRAEVVRRLEEAKQKYGVSYKEYKNYWFFELPENMLSDESKAFRAWKNNMKSNRADNKAARIEKVAKRTGLSLEEAKSMMDAAKKRIGITYAEFANNDFFLVPREDEERALRKIKEAKKKQAQAELDDCIQYVSNETGLDKKTVMLNLHDAIRRTGVTIKNYRKYRFFEIPEEEQRSRVEEIAALLESRAKMQKEDMDHYFEVIAAETGWDYDEVIEKTNDAKKRTGATWKDFYAFKFWNLTEEEQKTFFTTEISKEVSKRYDRPVNRDKFSNKENFLREFSPFLGREWCISSEISLEEFKDKFAETGKVIYKPSDNGNSGSGIEVFDLGDNLEAAYNEISKLPRGLVEGYIKQHSKMNSLYPNSVNTLRIATLCRSQDDKEECDFHILYGVLRIGSGGSAVDNFTTGGMVAALDLNAGKTETEAVNVDGDVFAKHPDTGVEIKGFEVPYFKEALELVTEAGRDICGYIGWDVAITEKGPILIEANIDPGNRLLQMPYVNEKKGMAHVVNKYLED